VIAVLSITAPIFAVIALGYGCLRWRLFRPQDLPVLSTFVVNIALPALLFNAVASVGLGELIDPGYLVAYAAGSLAVLGGAYLWFRTIGYTLARSAAAAMGTSLSNTGYVGYPILLLAYPQVAQKVLALNVSVENFVVFPVAMILMALDQPRGDRGAARQAVAIVASVMRRPMVLGFLAGLAWTVSSVPVPAVVLRIASILGSATAPIALFYIGGSLAGLSLTGHRMAALQIVLGKLVGHPALVALAAAAMPTLGIAIEPDLRGPIVLVASVPMMGIYAILAGEKGHQGMASLALLGATCLSFFTVSGLLAWLR
jgi:malonate transporter